MNISEKLREIRQRQGLSQEQLAEKIGVSRQAITKWETGKGLPDIENMVILSEIFKTTLDELITDTVKKEKVYRSDTLYDIDCERHFDIQIGNARTLTLSSGEDEKLHISLMSDTMENVGEAFKIKLDPGKNKLDVNCIKENKVSRFEAEDALNVMIVLPKKYAQHIELGASVQRLEIAGLHIGKLEYDGEASEIVIKDADGSLEFTGKQDYEISVENLKGRIDVNQWKARTLLHVSEKNCPKIVNKGKKCDVHYLKNGVIIEQPENSCEDEVQVSGVFSELVVDIAG